MMATNKELKNYIKMFEKIDKDHNGTITIDELNALTHDKNWSHLGKSTAEWQQMLQQMDQNGNGEIDFSEFVQAVYDYSSLMSTEKIKNAFDFFDTDKDGAITRDELQQVFAANKTCSRESKQFDNTW